MTVVLVAHPVSYVGLSSDTKPSAPPAGSKFYELNTGVWWIYDGEKWVEDISMIYALSQVVK